MRAEYCSSTTGSLIREFGMSDVLQAIITHCDGVADFASLSNLKRDEEYWRQSAVVVYDALKRLPDPPKRHQSE